MISSKVVSRILKSGSNHSRGIFLSHQPEKIHAFSCNIRDSSYQVPGLGNSLNNLVHNTGLTQRFGFWSAASSQSKENDEEDTSVKVEYKNSRSDSEASTDNSDILRKMSMEELVGLVTETDELLKLKKKEMENMQDKVLRSYAEMENVMDRTKREAENSKKFAIQSFAKSLLDVADNLGRASIVVKESFSKIDISKDTSGVVPLLKTLLEGVDMTDKQLAEVFKKFGVEKYDPMNEQFDPHRHNAVYQIPDASKAPDLVASVLKPGYTLFDRVIRPAAVGVTKAP